MANFNPDNTASNAKRCGEHMERALKTPGITDQLTSDESDIMYHLRDVMFDIYNKERYT